MTIANPAPLNLTNGAAQTAIVFSSAAAASSNYTPITNVPTQLLSIFAASKNPANTFLKFYDAGIPNTSGVGQTAVGVMMIPTNGTANYIPGRALSTGTFSGLQFAAGLAVSVTANPTLTDNSGTSGTDVTVWLGYR